MPLAYDSSTGYPGLERAVKCRAAISTLAPHYAFFGYADKRKRTAVSLSLHIVYYRTKQLLRRVKFGWTWRIRYLSVISLCQKYVRE
jgi:hypothetical protein